MTNNIRSYIKEEIVYAYEYRDEKGNKNYTHTVGFLFSYEIPEIKKFGFNIRNLTCGYNLIVFYPK